MKKDYGYKGFAVGAFNSVELFAKSPSAKGIVGKNIYIKEISTLDCFDLLIHGYTDTNQTEIYGVKDNKLFSLYIFADKNSLVYRAEKIIKSLILAVANKMKVSDKEFGELYGLDYGQVSESKARENRIIADGNRGYVPGSHIKLPYEEFEGCFCIIEKTFDLGILEEKFNPETIALELVMDKDFMNTLYSYNDFYGISLIEVKTLESALNSVLSSVVEWQGEYDDEMNNILTIRKNKARFSDFVYCDGKKSKVNLSSGGTKTGIFTCDFAKGEVTIKNNRGINTYSMAECSNPVTL